MSSSVMPSLRYSLFGSGLALTNGSTAIERVVTGVRAAPGASGAISATTNSAALVKRWFGSLSSARTTARSVASGTSGRSPRSGRGDAVTCFAMTARAPAPRNGASPPSISYTTQARL